MCRVLLHSWGRDRERDAVNSASDLEQLFLTLWREMKPPGVPDPIREYPFASPRRFRADFAWPAEKVMVEIQGGIYSKGRHTRGGGFEADCEKRCLATYLGWRVFELTRRMLEEEPARWLGMIAELICK